MLEALKRAMTGYRPPSPDICYLQPLYLYNSNLFLARYSSRWLDPEDAGTTILQNDENYNIALHPRRHESQAML